MMMIFALMAQPAAAPPRADSREDDRLVDAIIAGDERAFSDLYQRHVDRVYARLTRLIGPVPEREDVTQQVFVDVYRALPSFRRESRFSTFLYRIVARAAYDHLASRRRRRTAGDIDDFDLLVGHDVSPAERARQRDDLERAFSLLAQLTPKKRIAFVLHVIEGLSQREVARLVGASEPTVKQRVLHARRELAALERRSQQREVV